MTVTLTIDGRRVTVAEGTLIIRAAESLGVEIPRFCDHPYLEPVGACRTCLVEVEGQAKLVTSCTTPVAPDMVVRTQNTSEGAAKGQRGQLEFLLINHPLDCPVCDRGGECPLQDQTMAFGPAESRYIDPKRVFEKPIELSPQVLLDRERCVLCARCTRFCDEISGERFIELFERGAAEQVSIAPGEDFASPFSGNTVQICPVGALTSSSYRFAARPFDVKRGDSICPHCACGCSLRVDTRRGEVVRHLARDEPEVNEAWLCDKGRNAFRFPDRDRLETPMLRVPGLEPASHAVVFAEIAARARGGARAASLGGARLTDEDAYAMAKLARTAFASNDLDHRLGVGAGSWDLERMQAAPGMPVTYGDVERASAILVVGLDTREELPILHLRIRKAHRKGGARVVVLHPRRTALDVAEHLSCPPGGEAAALAELRSGSDEVATALREAGDGLVILAGPRLAESPGALEQAASLAADHGGKIAYLSRRANDRGALRSGVHPALLPGGRRVDDAAERAEVEAVWGGPIPAGPGRSTKEILEACAAREIDLLFLVGVDPLTDFPDEELVRRALANAGYTVIVDVSLGEYEPFADAAIPAAAFLEKAGHLTDWEGRGQRIAPARDPVGLSRPEWRIFQELSEVLGADLGFGSLEDLQAELGGLLASREVAAAASVPALADAPARDELTLFTYPLLVDDGRLSVDAVELKAALHREPFLEAHPADAERLGLADGGRARIRTERGQAELPVVVTDGVHEGAAFIPYNQEGLRMSRLLAGSTIAPVEIEVVAEEEAAEAVAEGAG